MVMQYDYNTVNVEGFTGLNFRAFQEYHESFLMNIYLYIYKLCKMVLFNVKHCESFPMKTSLG